MVHIRTAVTDDATMIAHVHAAAHLQTNAPLFGTKARALNVADLERRWRQALSDGDPAFVATDGSSIVGLAHAHGDTIDALYLLAKYRRKGIGARLLSRLLQALWERRVLQARFNVLAINHDAIAFYEAMGAHLVGRCTMNDPEGNYEDLVYTLPTAQAAWARSLASD